MEGSALLPRAYGQVEPSSARRRGRALLAAAALAVGACAALASARGGADALRPSSWSSRPPSSLARASACDGSSWREGCSRGRASSGAGSGGGAGEREVARRAETDDGGGGDDDDACAAYPKTLCQTEAACQWRASDASCFNRTAGGADSAVEASVNYSTATPR